VFILVKVFPYSFVFILSWIKNSFHSLVFQVNLSLVCVRI